MAKKQVEPLKIVPMYADNSNIVPLSGANSYVSEELIPKCPKCHKSPLRCQFPDSCGLDDL